MITTTDNVLMLLGYGATYSNDIVSKRDTLYYGTHLANLSTLPTHIQNRVDSLVTSLNAIDTALQSAPLDGMATKVDKLEVSYTQYTSLLKKEGSRTLNEISMLVNVPLVYDRYLQRKTSTRVVSPYNVVNYW